VWWCAVRPSEVTGTAGVAICPRHVSIHQLRQDLLYASKWGGVGVTVSRWVRVRTTCGSTSVSVSLVVLKLLFRQMWHGAPMPACRAAGATSFQGFLCPASRPSTQVRRNRFISGQENRRHSVGNTHNRPRTVGEGKGRRVWAKGSVQWQQWVCVAECRGGARE